MIFSSKTYCLVGVALIIAAIVGLSVAVSIHPTSDMSALTVPLPPTGSTLSLSPEQLAEERADPSAGFHFWLGCLGLLVDASTLCEITLLILGIVKYPREISNRNTTQKFR